MTINSTKGFTIIEVMLFLAITGGLFAALMVGVNVGIVQQRYRDSGRSYQSLIQDQYARVLNTQNDREASLTCNPDGSGNVDDTTTIPRGTQGASECVILGRAIQIKNSGQTVEASSVTGYDVPLSDTDDITAIRNYKPKLASFDMTSTDLDWGSSLKTTIQSGAQHPSEAVILILRSPISGLVRVFVSTAALSPGAVDLLPIVDSTHTSLSATLQNCLDGDSGMLPKQMITISPQIAGSDAVSIDDGSSPLCNR